MFAALRQRNFARLWVAHTVSFIGNWILIVALPFHVYAVTGSALATGALFMVETVPQIALSSVAGVFVDRWDRRRTMLVADVLRAAVLLPLLLAQSAELVWVVYLVAFAQACASQFAVPATTAIIPRLVPSDRLVEANALYGLTNSTSGLIGPALGGVLLAAVGLPGVALLDSGSFLVSAAFIYWISVAPRTASPAATAGGAGVAAMRSVWRELVEGIERIRGDRLVGGVFVAFAFGSISMGIILASIVIFVQDVLGGGSTEFGLFLTAYAAGGLAGGVAVAQAGRRWPATALTIAGQLGATLMFLAMVNVHVFGASLAFIAGVGALSSAAAVGEQTLLQRAVADSHRGRVFGALMAMGSVASLGGMAAAATLIDLVGVLPIFNAAVAIEFLAVPTLLWAFRGAPEAVARGAATRP